MTKIQINFILTRRKNAEIRCVRQKLTRFSNHLNFEKVKYTFFLLFLLYVTFRSGGFFLLKGLLTFDHLALNSIAKMLEFYTYLFANRSQFERMQRNSKIPNSIATTFFFLFGKKTPKICREFFMLDNLLWGISCKVSPNPIICCHQTYPVNLAFIGLLTFEFLFPNKLKKHFITLLFYWSNFLLHLHLLK